MPSAWREAPLSADCTREGLMAAPCYVQEADDATMGRDVFNEKPALEDLLAAENGAVLWK